MGALHRDDGSENLPAVRQGTKNEHKCCFPTGNSLLTHGVNPPVSVWEFAAEPVASVTKCEALIEK